MRSLEVVLKDIQKKVEENRKGVGPDLEIRDFRRNFDEASARMNQAIFNDQPSGGVYQETLESISALVEILVRS